MYKNFEIYEVEFEGIYNDNRATVNSYDEALKIFNRYKKNKKYESHRKNAKAIVMNGWNYEDVEITNIKREEFP